MEIALNDGNLRYSGRIDRHDPLRPEWVFPATSLYFRYSGGGAALTVENRRVCWDNYVGAIVDGRQKCWRLQPRGDTRICLTEDDGCHEVLFFKRMDSCHELMLKKLSLSPPVYPGIMDIWDKVHYHPELGPVTDWDFENYTPHVVLVAVGQNDSHPVDYMKEDPEGEAAVRWRGAFSQGYAGNTHML